MKEREEDWIWVDEIKENEGGRRELDMGGQVQVHRYTQALLARYSFKK